MISVALCTLPHHVWRSTTVPTNANSPEPTNIVLFFDPGLASSAELKLWHDDVFWGGILQSFEGLYVT